MLHLLPYIAGPYIGEEGGPKTMEIPRSIFKENEKIPDTF